MEGRCPELLMAGGGVEVLEQKGRCPELLMAGGEGVLNIEWKEGVLNC